MLLKQHRHEGIAKEMASKFQFAGAQHSPWVQVQQYFLCVYTVSRMYSLYIVVLPQRRTDATTTTSSSVCASLG